MNSTIKVVLLVLAIQSGAHSAIVLSVYPDDVQNSVTVNVLVNEITDTSVIRNFTLKYTIAELSVDTEVALEINPDQNYTINSLEPGVYVQVKVSAIIDGNLTEKEIDYTKTPGVAKDIRVTNISNNIAYFTFIPPTGFYDTLTVLCYTAELNLFYKANLTKNATSGLCRNVTSGNYFFIIFSTVKRSTTAVSNEEAQIVTSLDCTLLTYDMETNSINWTEPTDFNDANGISSGSFAVYIQLSNQATNESILNTTVYSPNTTLTFPKLEYNTYHEVQVRSVRWNIQDKQFCSLPFVSPPCPVIYHTTDTVIGDLSDVDTVKISISNETFTPLDKIDYIQVHVGTFNDCVERNYSDKFDENCFIAMNETIDAWDWTEETLSIRLSQVEKCTKNICNAKLKIKTTYYVTFKAINDCNFEISNKLEIRIAEPFPIPMAVGITLGVSVGLVLIGIIILVIWRQARNKKTIRREVLTNNFDDLKNPEPFDIERIDEKIRVLSLDSNFGFANEFQIIDTYSPKCDVRESANPRMLLDRYINISADGIFERTRVKITSSNGDDYVNANFVAGVNGEHEYIAAQGPLPNTINEFWQMIHEQNVDFVLMLTVCVDKYGKKCEKYWPDLNETIEYGDYVVTNSSEINKTDYFVRFLKFRHRGGQLRIITQYQYITWNDHSIPESLSAVLEMIRVVRADIKSKSSRSPIIVHCSAGVGRSGTYIALDRVLQQIQRGEKVDIFENVLKIRRDRCLLVQTENQYMSLYFAIQEYFQKDGNIASVSL